MQKFARYSREKIGILGDGGHRRRNRKEIRKTERSYLTRGKSVMSTQVLEVFILGVGTALRLESDAWSMVKWLRQYVPSPFKRRGILSSHRVLRASRNFLTVYREPRQSLGSPGSVLSNVWHGEYHFLVFDV